MDRSALTDRLRAALPASAVITDPAALKPYETDGLTAVREPPGVVVLPEDVAQLKRVIGICAELDVPLVPRGAGTGLSGGARPMAEGVLLGLSKLNRILSIDPDNRIAVAEPGVRNLAITEAAAAFGLYYAPDPSSQIACSIGGNVAENSGGVHCLKYGLTVHNVVGVKMLTSAAEELCLGGASLEAPGFDLLAVINGSEGMLGVITEVTVRLLPEPPCRQVLLAAFDEVEDAASAVARIITEGIIPAGLEMMDRLAIAAAEQHVGVGYPLDAAAILLCELDGSEAEVRSRGTEIEALLRAAGATDVRRSRDDAERERMWLGRKAAFPAVGRLSPDYYCMDGTIPRARLAEVLRTIAGWSADYGLQVANVFHAGDGNLHPLILYDANAAGELERAVEFGGRILELCVEVGGTITGEHGVGVEKLDQMCVQFDSDELAQMHRLKSAFDPSGMLNPGKAVPTLARCAELGGMHVHGGALPHPELERF